MLRWNSRTQERSMPCELRLLLLHPGAKHALSRGRTSFHGARLLGRALGHDGSSAVSNALGRLLALFEGVGYTLEWKSGTRRNNA